MRNIQQVLRQAAVSQNDYRDEAADTIDTLQDALTRALFLLESPVIKPLANGARTVDHIRDTLNRLGG